MVDKILFLIFAVLAVGGGLGTITRKNVVHALLLLVFTFINIAAIFFLTQAYFLAVVQILVYAGAIMVLFVFVVMFLNLRTFQEQEQTHRGQRWIALVLSVLGLAEVSRPRPSRRRVEAPRCSAMPCSTRCCSPSRWPR
jgi:NADH:ubiquinone oxidoreductase subunit 6 (subunit J)